MSFAFRSIDTRKMTMALASIASILAFSPNANALEMSGVDAQDTDLRVRLVERRGQRPRNRDHHLVKVELNRGASRAEFFCDLSGIIKRDGRREFADCHKSVSSVSGDDDESLSFEVHLGEHGGFSIQNISVTGDRTSLGDDLHVLIGTRELASRLRIELNPTNSVDASESVGVLRIAGLATQQLVGLEVSRVVRFGSQRHEFRLPLESLRWSIDGQRNLKVTGRLDVSSLEGVRIDDVFQAGETTLLLDPSDLDSDLGPPDWVSTGLRRSLLGSRTQRRR